MNTLFRLRDLQFWIGSRALDTVDAPLADLQASTFTTLTFTRQKNGVRGETIGCGRSGHSTLCPVLCLVSRVCALRMLNAPLSAPLNAYSTALQLPVQYVHAADITRRLRLALAIHPHPNYTARDISARSTRTGGAMALLCAGVDCDCIRLVGCWQSDELFRYLHVQAQPVMNGLAAAMLCGGSFSLVPGKPPPSHPLSLFASGLSGHQVTPAGVYLRTGVSGTVHSKDMATTTFTARHTTHQYAIPVKRTTTEARRSESRRQWKEARVRESSHPVIARTNGATTCLHTNYMVLRDHKKHMRTDKKFGILNSTKK